MSRSRAALGWLRAGALILACACRAAPALAVPTDSAFSEVPSRFQTRELTAGSRALGELCYGRDAMPDGTVCNPAFLPEVPEATVLGRIYLGNGYAAISTANNLLYQSISTEFLKDLFRNRNVTSLDANTGLVFYSRYFSAEYSPYRVQYVSEVHNPNLPVVAVHAAVEKRFVFAGGVPLELAAPGLRGFSLGARLSILSRDYIHGSFSLFQAVSEDPRSLLPVQNQRAVFLDPSLGWVGRDQPWKPRLSLAAQNLGPVTHPDPLYPNTADLVMGVGVEPPTGFGRLRLGLDVVDLIHGDCLACRLRLGASYKFGILESMVGANQDSLATGLEFGIQIIKVGIVYEFIRGDLDGAAVSNRISTEFAVSL